MVDECKKWLWMMDYCREKSIPSAQDMAWEKAKT
jgi:hypothetical protein